MKFDYVDIGTSDFDTSLNMMNKGQNILLVEPIKSYLDNLPSGKNIYKANYAVCHWRIRKGKVYYIKEWIIKKYMLPDWLKGCNSFGIPHITVTRFLKEFNLPPSFVSCDRVSIITFDKLVKLYKITSIGFLKIDTEGYDHVILEAVLSCMKKGLEVKKIQVEFNPAFGNTEELTSIIRNSGYINVSSIEDNVILEF